MRLHLSQISNSFDEYFIDFGFQTNTSGTVNVHVGLHLLIMSIFTTYAGCVTIQ